ncbi:MAG: hypothetical protein ABUT39_18175 [Acidobacteriota bacterium]
MLKRLGLLLLVPLAVPLPILAAEACKPVPYAGPPASPGLALSADGGWLASAGPSRLELFDDPAAAEPRFRFEDGGEAVALQGGLLATGENGVVRVYAYRDKWELVEELRRPGIRFGASVALGGGWLVVGAPEDGSFREGAAYVYSADTFDLKRILRPGDGRLNDRFGASVAVDGNTFVVGAPYADDLRELYNFGAVYVFRDGIEGAVAKLWASKDFRAGDIQFGASVAIRGSSIVVGAPGADLPDNNAAGSAYLFTLKPEGWTRTAELNPGDPKPGRLLGASVAIDEAGALVGAPGNGSAYLFRLTDGSRVDECGCGGLFGRSVALRTRNGQREIFLGGTDGVKGCFPIPKDPDPELTCEFESPPASAPAGSMVTYTVQVHNEGKEPEPAELQVSTTPDLGTGRCKPGRCSASIPGGGDKKFRVTFAVPRACEAPAAIQAEAFVVSGDTKKECTLSPTTRIERPVGVRGWIESADRSVLSGKEITYHLRLENDGPGSLLDGDGPELEHELPPDLRLVSLKVLAGGGTFERVDKPSGDPTEALLWNGSIPACGTVDLQVTALVPYDQGQVEERICLEATMKDLDGRKRSAAPYCFLIVPFPEITLSEGR